MAKFESHRFGKKKEPKEIMIKQHEMGKHDAKEAKGCPMC